MKYKSDVNENYMTYVPPQYISFQKNEGVNERVTDSVSKYLPTNAMKFRRFPHFCCIFHQFMDQVSTNNKLSITQQAKVGQGWLCKAM